MNQKLSERLQSIRERLEKATPEYKYHYGFDRSRTDPSAYGHYLEIGHTSTLISAIPLADRELILHARTDIEKLIRTVEIQAKEISALRDVLDAFGIDASTDLISWKEANYLAKEVEGVWL